MESSIGKLMTILCAAVTLLLLAALAGVGNAGAEQLIRERPENARPYAEGELAKRLQQIKQERLESARAGKTQARVAMNIAVPVLMGNYSDNAHIFTASDFQTLLFGANPTGSMTDYYDEVSYGQFHVSGMVYGPYTAAGSQAYYFNGNWGLGITPPRNAAGFCVSVLTHADSAIDFRQYDNDGPDGVPNSGDDDGFVDALIIIFPDGRGHWATDVPGLDVDNLAWNTPTFSDYYGYPYVTNDVGASGDNIKIDFFTIMPAEKWDGTLNEISWMGTFSHELAHQLGSPDLYDYDRDSWGVGAWCLMGFGNYGARWDTATAATPVHMSPWIKSYLGWLTPTLVTKAQMLEVPPVETMPTVYKMWEDGYQGGRYFLIENRTKTGFDKGLPGEGLLIWHCNEDECFDNSDNTFRLVDLEEADGLNFLDHLPVWGTGPTAGAIYPGPTNNTRFDDVTNPPATDVYGNPTNFAAYDIAYVSGPGSPVRVTIKPRVTYGLTLTYHLRSCDYFLNIRAPIIGYGGNGTEHGALRFTSPIAGSLVAVRPAARTAADFAVNVFDDIVGGVPLGFHTSSSTSFPAYRNPRYTHVPLSTPVSLTAGQTFVLDGSWGPGASPVPVTGYPPISGQSFYSASGSSFTPLTDLDVAMRAVIRYACIDSLSGDDDNDGIPNGCDNCIATANSNQADADQDGIGDACDNCTDLDGDGFGNPGYPANTCAVDNCPNIANPGQEDANHDGIGDACCCVAGTGNVDCDPSDGVDISDLSALIDNLYISFTPLCCPNEANTDGQSGTDISDLSALIDFLYITFTPTAACQ
jgi:M6 family metalloprotease-like protein